MRRLKYLITSFILVSALAAANAQLVKAYADENDPQGKSKSGPSSESPLSPGDVIIMVARAMGWR